MANFLWFTKLHRSIYEKTDGRLGAKMGHHPIALLHTIGAKSGLKRSLPLRYYPLSDEGILVLGSNNGQTKPPAWWFNLQAHPEIMIQVGREKRHVRAEQLDSQSAAAVWPEMVKSNPRIADYAKTANRELPVILLRTLDVLKR